jgi:ketopantoate reductase
MPSPRAELIELARLTDIPVPTLDAVYGLTMLLESPRQAGG